MCIENYCYQNFNTDFILSFVILLQSFPVPASFPATPDFNEEIGPMSRSESLLEFYDAQEYLPSSPSSSEDEVRKCYIWNTYT